MYHEVLEAAEHGSVVMLKAISVYLAHQPPSFRQENNLSFCKQQNSQFLDLTCLSSLRVLILDMIA